MSEILTTIQNATPALAAVIIGMLFTVRNLGKEIEELKMRIGKYDSMNLDAKLAENRREIENLKKRVEQYDDMDLGIKLAEIQKDIAYIRELMEERG